MDNENAGNAIGSTEPSVEDEAHWTPQMQALADRDVAVCHKHHTTACGVDRVIMSMGGPLWAEMKCGYTGRLQRGNME